jgi:hypothetical protein
MTLQDVGALSGGETGGAIDHRFARRESIRQRDDPFRGDANFFRPAAPALGAELITGDEHLHAWRNARRGRSEHGSRGVDSRHVRKLPDHAAMPGSGKRVFVIERRIGDADGHFRVGGRLRCAIGDPRADRAGFIPFDKVAPHVSVVPPGVT